MRAVGFADLVALRRACGDCTNGIMCSLLCDRGLLMAKQPWMDRHCSVGQMQLSAAAKGLRPFQTITCEQSEVKETNHSVVHLNLLLVGYGTLWYLYSNLCSNLYSNYKCLL